jgi:hypothetical protein
MCRLGRTLYRTAYAAPRRPDPRPMGAAPTAGSPANTPDGPTSRGSPPHPQRSGGDAPSWCPLARCAGARWPLADRGEPRLPRAASRGLAARGEPPCRRRPLPPANAGGICRAALAPASGPRPAKASSRRQRWPSGWRQGIRGSMPRQAPAQRPGPCDRPRDRPRHTLERLMPRGTPCRHSATRDATRATHDHARWRSATSV